MFDSCGSHLLIHDEPANTLLSVPAAELVAQLRDARAANACLDHEIVVGVRREHHAVDIPDGGGQARQWRQSVFS